MITLRELSEEEKQQVASKAKRMTPKMNYVRMIAHLRGRKMPIFCDAGASGYNVWKHNYNSPYAASNWSDEALQKMKDDIKKDLDIDISFSKCHDSWGGFEQRRMKVPYYLKDNRIYFYDDQTGIGGWFN